MWLTYRVLIYHIIYLSSLNSPLNWIDLLVSQKVQSAILVVQQFIQGIHNKSLLQYFTFESVQWDDEFLILSRSHHNQVLIVDFSWPNN